MYVHAYFPIYNYWIYYHTEQIRPSLNEQLENMLQKNMISLLLRQAGKHTFQARSQNKSNANVNMLN